MALGIRLSWPRGKWGEAGSHGRAGDSQSRSWRPAGPSTEVHTEHLAEAVELISRLTAQEHDRHMPLLRSQGCLRQPGTESAGQGLRAGGRKEGTPLTPHRPRGPPLTMPHERGTISTPDLQVRTLGYRKVTCCPGPYCHAGTQAQALAPGSVSEWHPQKLHPPRARPQAPVGPCPAPTHLLS